MGTAGGSTGVGRTAAPALATSAPLSLTEESSFPSYAHPCCDRARSAPSLSIGDRYERSPSAQPTWRVVTAGGSTGVDGTAAPALVTSAPLSPRNHRFLLMRTPAMAEPVARRHCRLATAMSGPRVPSPSHEWLPPVVRRESTGEPLQHWSHLPHSHRGMIISFLHTPLLWQSP